MLSRRAARISSVASEPDLQGETEPMRVLSASILAVTGLLLAAQPTAARAATVEWMAGPLTLAAGQAAEVLIGDPTISCSVGVQILAGRVAGRGAAFPLALVVNTFHDPNLVPAGRGLDVGFIHD